MRRRQGRGQDLGQYPERDGADVGVGGQATPAAGGDALHPAVVGGGGDGADGAAGQHPDALPFQIAPGGIAQGVGQGYDGVAHIGIVAPAQQAFLHNHQTHGGADGADIVVERAFNQHIPQVVDGAFRLPVRPQPLVEGNVLQGGGVAAGAH